MKALFSIIILFLPLLAFSQKASKDTLFLNLRWEETDDRSKAAYYRETFFDDKDSLLTVNDYYLKTGHLQMVGSYHRKMGPFNRHGRFEYFYPDESLKAVYHYNYGVTDGEIIKYYKNGQVKSTEKYKMGVQIDTVKTFFESGQMHTLEVINPNFSTKNPEERFKNKILLKAYSKEGELLVENGTGTFLDYFLSGKKKAEIEYKDGFIHGKWTQYTGVRNKVSSKMTFKEGRFIKGEIYDNGKKDVFSSLKRDAYFPTGIKGLDEFIKASTGNCENGFTNEVLILITIDIHGKVSLDQLISGNVNACQLEEIQNLIHYMPTWKPAVINGIYVEDNQTIRIHY